MRSFFSSLKRQFDDKSWNAGDCVRRVDKKTAAAVKSIYFMFSRHALNHIGSSDPITGFKNGNNGVFSAVAEAVFRCHDKVPITIKCLRI